MTKPIRVGCKGGVGNSKRQAADIQSSKKAKGGDIRTYYYFYDEDTQKETVVEQFE